MPLTRDSSPTYVQKFVEHMKYKMHDIQWFFIPQHRFGQDGQDIAHSRSQENVEEGNNNGLENVVRYLEKIYTKKDHPGSSPSLELSLR